MGSLNNTMSSQFLPNQITFSNTILSTFSVSSEWSQEEKKARISEKSSSTWSGASGSSEIFLSYTRGCQRRSLLEGCKGFPARRPNTINAQVEFRGRSMGRVYSYTRRDVSLLMVNDPATYPNTPDSLLKPGDAVFCPSVPGPASTDRRSPLKSAIFTPRLRRRGWPSGWSSQRSRQI